MGGGQSEGTATGSDWRSAGEAQRVEAHRQMFNETVLPITAACLMLI